MGVPWWRTVCRVPDERARGSREEGCRCGHLAIRRRARCDSCLPTRPRTTSSSSGARASTTCKDVSLDLPRDALIVFTGLSGSGKSRLAFDTIFAEGQRRYVESLSAYARQFLGQMDKPDVDFIEGLSPAVSIDQKSTTRNPRSTVGTITEVYDYLRLLYARAGRPHCPICGEPIARQSPAADRRPDARAARGHPLPGARAGGPGRKGEYVDLFAELQTKGFARARVDGVVVSLTEPPKLEKQKKHTIEVVVDRLVAKGDDAGPSGGSPTRSRPPSGWPAASSSSSSSTSTPTDPDRERRFSEKLACPNDHPLAIDELEPRSFSFNSPFGACPECTGLGTELEVDPELVVPDAELTLARRRDRAVGAAARSADYFLRLLQRRWPRSSASTSTRRGRRCPQRAQKAMLHGTGHKVHVQLPQPLRPRAVRTTTGFEGVVPWIERRHAETETD